MQVVMTYGLYKNVEKLEVITYGEFHFPVKLRVQNRTFFAHICD